MVFEAVTCDGLGCVANKQTNKQKQKQKQNRRYVNRKRKQI